MEKLSFVFLLGIVSHIVFYPVLGLVLSKSKITKCENSGKGGDPKNLVSGGSCQKKMFVLLSVKNNQKGTEKLYATVSRVRDETTNEFARLYNPFMITVAKSPVYLIYPYFYTGAKFFFKDQYTRFFIRKWFIRKYD